MLILDECKYGMCDVEAAYTFYYKWLLGKLDELFKWNNLPETIDEKFLNSALFLNGSVAWTTSLDGKLRTFIGNIGGEPDIYYSPKIFTVANPVVGSKELEINKDCVLMYNSVNDKYYNFLPKIAGLRPLIHQTATLLADNIVSINTAQINSRVHTIVTAESEATRNTAEQYLKRLYSGKPWSALTEDMLAAIHVNPVTSANSTNNIAQLISLHQYIIADFYNAVGIKTNPVNKKERLITGEIDSVDDYLAVNLEEMLKAREEAVEKINTKYGTNITVSVNDILKPVLEAAINPDEPSDSRNLANKEDEES